MSIWHENIQNADRYNKNKYPDDTFHNIFFSMKYVKVLYGVFTLLEQNIFREHFLLFFDSISTSNNTNNND